MKIMVIPIIIGAFAIVQRSLESRLEELEIGEQAETIQTTALTVQNTEKSPGNLLSIRAQ